MVNLKAEIQKLSQEKEQAEEKLREATDENAQLNNQIQNIIGKPMDDLEKREELELTRQMKIDNLEHQLHHAEEENADMQE